MIDKRSDSMNITASIPEKLLQIQGATRVVEATNDDRELRIYLSFAEPVMNSSAEVLAALTATGAVLTPTNRSTLGNRRFGFVVSFAVLLFLPILLIIGSLVRFIRLNVNLICVQVNKISSTAVVTVACDTSSVISRQGTPVYSSQPFTFLYGIYSHSCSGSTTSILDACHVDLIFSSSACLMDGAAGRYATAFC